MNAKAMRILFVDVETDGLPTGGEFNTPVRWPHIVQAAWIVSDGEGTILRCASRIVKPVGFTIPADATAIHGITTQMAKEQGTASQTILHVLGREVSRANLIVAHNLEFDAHVIDSESKRFSKPCAILSKPGYCTMKETTDLCKLHRPNTPYAGERKWPRLEELYIHLFGHTFTGAHDAAADVRACYDCFWQLVRINWI